VRAVGQDEIMGEVCGGCRGGEVLGIGDGVIACGEGGWDSRGKCERERG
jgi:hypothetical protein